ncbi:MAG: SusC/RagA family TonB-linked outer membrane protein, partial [Bacteroidota bacterium]|nr:SusC/RagA family TonB-linked outer membrane protein [Bacteroidota bacterium]
PLPGSAGIGGSVQSNVGEMVNKGLEAVLDYNNKIGDFRYGITVNGAFNRNKLLTLNPELEGVFINDGGTNEAYNTTASRTEPGLPLGQFYGLIAEGIYADNEGRVSRPTISGDHKPQAGDLIYRDLNDDGVINDDDRDYIGNPWPKLTYGLNLSLGYKGFDLSAFFNGVQGVDIYNAAQVFSHTFYTDYNTTNKIYETSFFTPETGLTDKPRAGNVAETDKNGNWNRISSFHVENGSFLRLRNLQLGYTIPPSILNRLNISSARIFVMGNNLFTITKYSGMDPELAGLDTRAGSEGNRAGGVRARGIDAGWNRYPLTRLFSIGLNLEF